MCGGKKKTPAPAATVVPTANPKAVADTSNDIVPGTKIAAQTTNPSTFGSELGSTATPVPA